MLGVLFWGALSYVARVGPLRRSQLCVESRKVEVCNGSWAPRVDVAGLVIWSSKLCRSP